MKTGREGPEPPTALALSQIATIMHLFRRYRQVHVSAYGVTVPQFNALVQLDRHGPLNPSRIATLLFSDRPTTSVILRNMERQGWVKRARDEKNRKFVLIRITKAGKQKLRELRVAEEAQTGDFELLACFSTDEVAQLEGLLDKLIQHFHQLPTIVGPQSDS